MKIINAKNIYIHLIIWALVIILTSAFTSWKSESERNRILKVDGLGYYSYLPAFFIYQDLNFHYYDSIYQSDLSKGKQPYDFRERSEYGTINKYYIGSAICQIPFFIPVYTYFKISGKVFNGYENAFQVASHIAAICFFLLGLYYVFKTLETFQLSKTWAILSCYAILLGTNAGYMVVSEPGLSHLYSFAWISIFLYATRKLVLSNFQKKWIWISGLAIGFILLIRPINLIILFALPFIWGNIKLYQSKKLIQSYIQIGILSIMLFSIQFIYYYLATGNAIIYSYNEEGFDFMHAHFFEFLWSYRKGFFLYTPLFLLLFPSLILGIKERKYKSILSFIFFFVILTFVFSSWWLWHYGGGLGTRVFIEFYPLFIIPIVWYFSKLKQEFVKSLSILFLLVSVYFGQLTHWQYRQGKIHWDSATKEQYYDNLFRIDNLL